MTPDPAPPTRTPTTGSTRAVESLLWLAAGAAWALVAVRAWNQTRKVEAQRRLFSISDGILKQVFPHGIRR